MTKPNSDTTEEIWESQVPGRTFVETRDYDGRRRSVTCVGVGSRLRLATSDRERTQERITSAALDPFRNGTLLRVDANQQEDESTQSPDALSEAELRACFEMDDLDDFREYVGSLGEVNLRKLKAMAADAGATLNQAKFITDLIDERYAIGGDTPTYREMNQGPNTPS